MSWSRWYVDRDRDYDRAHDRNHDRDRDRDRIVPSLELRPCQRRSVCVYVADMSRICFAIGSQRCRPGNGDSCFSALIAALLAR